MKAKNLSPVRKSSRPMPDHTQDWAWIKAHENEYLAQWVMVAHGQLIAADPSLRSLLNKVPHDRQKDSMVWFIEVDTGLEMGYF